MEWKSTTTVLFVVDEKDAFRDIKQGNGYNRIYYRVVGNIPQLGNWKVMGAPPMNKTSGKLELSVEVDNNVDVIEYKYIRSTLNSVQWENGANREIYMLAQPDVQVNDVPFDHGGGAWSNVHGVFVDLAELEEREKKAVAGNVNAMANVNVNASVNANSEARKPLSEGMDERQNNGEEDGQQGPRIIRVFSLPFFNPMTEKERQDLRDNISLVQNQKPSASHLVDGLGRLFTKPIVVNR